MDRRDLNLKEFFNLPFERRRSLYESFSDEDKLRVRLAEPISAKGVPCNDCVYREDRKRGCSAFPDGPSRDHILKLLDDPFIECGNGYRYKPKND